MGAKLTTSRFLRNIQLSGLLEEKRLDGVLEKLEAAGVDLDDPESLSAALVEREVLTPWQASNLLQGKHRGFILGPYRFLSLLGKGGMGAVYLAEHQMMRRRCAIKVLPSKSAKSGTSLLDRFYREAQAVAALDHPNIVRAYDVNKDVQGSTEIHYLVMEYVDGRDLQQLVDERGCGLDYAQAADFVRQAAKGLAHAHQNGLIHRDIKPANLLIDHSDCLKILDLGLARFFEDAAEEASLTKAHGESTLGTADYLSPEQALDSHDIDTRSDIYSLGCTLYFMLTTSAPFPEGTVAQRLMAHQAKAPKPIQKFRSDVPADLVAIVDRMIAKKPDDRFQTCDEIAEVMSAWLAEHADDQWKQDHPEAVSGVHSGSGVRSQRSSPTVAISQASHDTDTELGFAPDADDDDPPGASGSSGSLASASGVVKGAGDSSVTDDDGLTADADEPPKLTLPDVNEPSADLLSELDDLEEFGEGGSSSDDLLADPLAAAPLPGDPLAAAAAAPARNKPAAEPGESRSPLFWAAVIGGPAVALLLIVIMILAWPPSDPQVASDISPPHENPTPRTIYPRDSGQDAGGAAAQPAGGQDSQQPGSDDTQKKQGRQQQEQQPQEQQPQGQQAVAGGGPSQQQPGSQPDGGDGGDGSDGSPPAGPAPTGPSQASAPGASPPTPPEMLTDPARRSDPSGAAGGPPQRPDSEPPPSSQGGSQPPSQPPAPSPTGDSPPQAPGNAGDGTGGGTDSKGPDTAPLTPQRRQQLWAEIEQVAIGLQSADPRPQSPFNLTILRIAAEGLDEAGYKVKPQPAAEGDPAVLSLKFTAEKSEETSRIGGRQLQLVQLNLEAELSCQDGGRRVPVWRSKEEVGKLVPELLRGSSVPPVLRSGLSKFFTGFVRDVEQKNSGSLAP